MKHQRERTGRRATRRIEMNIDLRTESAEKMTDEKTCIGRKAT